MLDQRELMKSWSSGKCTMSRAGYINITSGRKIVISLHEAIEGNSNIKKKDSMSRLPADH